MQPISNRTQENSRDLAKLPIDSQERISFFRDARYVVDSPARKLSPTFASSITTRTIHIHSYWKLYVYIYVCMYSSSIYMYVRSAGIVSSHTESSHTMYIDD